MARLADSEATIRHLISQLDARTARAEAAERDTAGLHQRLSPLCPCVDAPMQECPLHGDGETFVAYVQNLEALASRARTWVANLPNRERVTAPAALALIAAVDEMGGA